MRLIPAPVSKFPDGIIRLLLSCLLYTSILENAVTPVDAVFADYPKITADESHDRLLHNGNAVPVQYAGQTVRMYDSFGQFIGLYAAYEDKSGYKPLKMFYSR